MRLRAARLLFWQWPTRSGHAGARCRQLSAGGGQCCRAANPDVVEGISRACAGRRAARHRRHRARHSGKRLGLRDRVAIGESGQTVQQKPKKTTNRRKRMKKMMGTVAFATTLAVAGAAFAADTIRIGAMPVGSGWYVAAAAIEQALKPVMGSTPVEVIARGGGVANPMVVEQGKAEIAMSNVATSVWAMNGEELYQGKKAPNIRSLVGGLNSVYMAAIVKNDYIKKTGFDTM